MLGGAPVEGLGDGTAVLEPVAEVLVDVVVRDSGAVALGEGLGVPMVEERGTVVVGTPLWEMEVGRGMMVEMVLDPETM